MAWHLTNDGQNVFLGLKDTVAFELKQEGSSFMKFLEEQNFKMQCNAIKDHKFCFNGYGGVNLGCIIHVC